MPLVEEPEPGAGLAVDLYRLWLAGRDNLPSVAREFAVANGHVAETDHGLVAAFWRPGHFGGDYGPVLAAWTALRDEIQRILGDTATNLEMVADALCAAATEYAAGDHETAEMFNRLKIVNGDPVPPTIPPPQYP